MQGLNASYEYGIPHDQVGCTAMGSNYEECFTMAGESAWSVNKILMQWREDPVHDGSDLSLRPVRGDCGHCGDMIRREPT